jgi:hypothetical protein
MLVIAVLSAVPEGHFQLPGTSPLEQAASMSPPASHEVAATTGRVSPPIHYLVMASCLAIVAATIFVTADVLTSGAPSGAPAAGVSLGPANPDRAVLASHPAAAPRPHVPSPRVSLADASPVPGVALEAAAPVPSVVLDTYVNPVSTLDFPDPDVVDAGGTYVAFGTGNIDAIGVNVSEISTTNLATWPDDAGHLTDALPRVGSWATTSTYERVWAPSVIAVGGSWLLFYAAVDSAVGVRCIGVATSDTVLGPYQDANPGPLTCQAELGGDLDPDAFWGANGQLYLAWKSNDGSSTQPASLWDAPVRPSPGGVTVAGSPVRLLTQDQGWETTVENPAMMPLGGGYLLLFSGGDWQSAGYAESYALCQGPLGPCHEPLDHPILSSTPLVAGPGGASVFTDPRGNHWVAYAAWSESEVGYGAGGSRSLRIDPLCLASGSPVIDGPTSSVESLQSGCQPANAPRHA